MIARLELRKLTEESDHVRCGAHISEFTEEPRQVELYPETSQLLLLELVDLVVRVVDDGHCNARRLTKLLHQALMQKLGETPRIAVAIVHHANFKINKLKVKQLAGLGIKLNMPSLLGTALLRQANESA